MAKEREQDSDPSYFRHVSQDDSASVTEEFVVTHELKTKLQFRILTTAPHSRNDASFLLARYRVAALIHMLQGWLDATKDPDE